MILVWSQTLGDLARLVAASSAAFPGGLFHFLEHHAYIAGFLLLFLEESGVPLPVPGDTVMLVSGYLVYRGELNPLLSFLCLEAGTIGGASVLYWIARRAGAPLLARYGRHVGLHEERLHKAEAWLRRRGPWGIVLGRLIPGLRIPTSVVSGTLQLPFSFYLPRVALGSSLYVATFFILGWALGDQTPRLLRTLRHLPLPLHPALLLVAVALIAVVTMVVIWQVRRRRPQA